jgi:hypothetical protein
MVHMIVLGMLKVGKSIGEEISYEKRLYNMEVNGRLFIDIIIYDNV